MIGNIDYIIKGSLSLSSECATWLNFIVWKFWNSFFYRAILSLSLVLALSSSLFFCFYICSVICLEKAQEIDSTVNITRKFCSLKTIEFAMELPYGSTGKQSIGIPFTKNNTLYIFSCSRSRFKILTFTKID